MNDSVTENASIPDRPGPMKSTTGPTIGGVNRLPGEREDGKER